MLSSSSGRREKQSKMARKYGLPQDSNKFAEEVARSRVFKSYVEDQDLEKIRVLLALPDVDWSKKKNEYAMLHVVTELTMETMYQPRNEGVLRFLALTLNMFLEYANELGQRINPVVIRTGRVWDELFAQVYNITPEPEDLDEDDGNTHASRMAAAYVAISEYHRVMKAYYAGKLSLRAASDATGRALLITVDKAERHPGAYYTTLTGWKYLVERGACTTYAHGKAFCAGVLYWGVRALMMINKLDGDRLSRYMLDKSRSVNLCGAIATRKAQRREMIRYLLATDVGRDREPKNQSIGYRSLYDTLLAEGYAGDAAYLAKKVQL